MACCHEPARCIPGRVDAADAGAFPLAASAKDSNESFSLLRPQYLTSAKLLICHDDWESGCRFPATGLSREEFEKPNTVSFAYVAGLTEKSSKDSPLAGDNLMNPSKSNDLSIQQFQRRVDCSTKGSDHGADGGNVVFADGHALFNFGKLKDRWVDGLGGTSLIKNPNGLQ